MKVRFSMLARSDSYDLGGVQLSFVGLSHQVFYMLHDLFPLHVSHTFEQT